jgi:hypothetical protein
MLASTKRPSSRKRSDSFQYFLPFSLAIDSINYTSPFLHSSCTAYPIISLPSPLARSSAITPHLHRSVFFFLAVSTIFLDVIIRTNDS